MRSYAFIATLCSFAGNLEVKAGIKTYLYVVEGFTLRVTTPSRACEPNGFRRFWSIIRISQNLLAGDFANGELQHILQSQRVSARASRLKCSCFLLAIGINSCLNDYVAGSILELLYQELTFRN